MSEPQIFTTTSSEPDFGPGTVVAVNYGDYRTQEIWVACGANVGNWYPLGNPFGRPKALDDPRPYAEQLTSREPWRRPPGTVPLHPHWEDIVARGPVTLLVPAQGDAYRAGWHDGRRDLVQDIAELAENEPQAGAA